MEISQISKESSDDGDNQKEAKNYEATLNEAGKMASEEFKKRYPATYKDQGEKIEGMIKEILDKENEILSASLPVVDKTDKEEMERALQIRANEIVRQVEEELKRQIQ